MTKLMAINWEKGNEFIVMGFTSIPQLTQLGNNLLVAMAVPFTMYAKVYADLAWGNRWKKVAMLVTSNIYGDTWRKSFENEWLKKGGEVTYSAGTDYYKRTDFAVPLAKALATNPDCMLIGGPTATTTLIIEQARAKGYEGGFILIDQAKLDAIHPAMRKPLLLEGSIGLAMFKDVEYPVKAAFAENYKATFKRPVSWESAVHYTSMHVLAKAIAASGSPDSAKAIRAAFPSVFPVLADKYPVEMYGIQPNGTLILPALVQSMKYGKYTPAQIYIWWPNSQKEFDQVKAMSKYTNRLIWRPMGN
jgi:branched-chain amino acid transport system substrate-binding protein